MNDWKTLIATAQQIDRLDDLATGDIAFLNTGSRLAAFTVQQIVRSGPMTRLYVSHTRFYALGGPSTVQYEFALRPAPGKAKP